MPDLKLIALDAEDLQIISAHLQDAIVRVGDMTYLPREKRFAALLNRFDWDRAINPPKGGGAGKKRGRNASAFERRRTGLRLERVLGAKVHGVNLGERKTALELLAITFEPTGEAETPGGDVTLTFSGGAAIRLSVECLELEMRDLGAAWAAKSVPQHPDEES